jgi:hypothetical protein
MSTAVGALPITVLCFLLLLVLCQAHTRTLLLHTQPNLCRVVLVGAHMASLRMWIAVGTLLLAALCALATIEGATGEHKFMQLATRS